MLQSSLIKNFIKKIHTSELLWPILIFILFWMLMHTHSGMYEFLIGDNLVQFFPGMVHNGREFFSGSVPLINYHHFLGYESLLTGYYGGLYLPIYVAYFLSHHVFGNDFFLLGILAFYHYFVAFVGFFMLLRRFLRHKLFCCVASLGYIFAATYVNYVAEWWYVLIPMAYLPWITFFSLKVIDRFSEPIFNRKKMMFEMIILALIMASVALAGNSHFTLLMYTCGGLFAFFYFLGKINTIIWKRLPYILIIVPFLAVGISAMFLFSDYAKDSDSKQGHKDAGYMIGNHLKLNTDPKSFIMAPFNHQFDFSTPTYESAHVRFEGENVWPMGFINGMGLLAFVLFIPWYIFKRSSKGWFLDDQKRIVFTAFLIAVLGLILACGYRPLYEFLSRSESLSKLMHAHKNYFVAMFYISLFAGLFWGTCFEKLSKKIRKFWYRIFIILGIFTTIVNIVVITQITHWNFTDETLPIKPNLSLPKEKRMVHVGDFFDYQPNKKVCGEYMGFTCASLFNYHVFGNYEPLLPMQQSLDLNYIAGRTDAGYKEFSYGLYEILKEFGVCTIVNRYAYMQPDVTVSKMRIPLDRAVVTKVSDEAYAVEDLDCHEYKIDQGLVTNREYHGDRIVFDLENVDQDTVLNVKNYYLDRYRAYDQNGTRLELKVTVNEETIIGRNMIDVLVPAGTTQVTIRYHHPILVFLFWASFLIYGMLVWLIFRYFRNSSSTKNSKGKTSKKPNKNGFSLKGIWYRISNAEARHQNMDQIHFVSPHQSLSKRKLLERLDQLESENEILRKKQLKKKPSKPKTVRKKKS